ncbi:MAG TPA: hypothetical protein VF510_24020 [Ktedonobacterales bacterium]
MTSDEDSAHDAGYSGNPSIHVRTESASEEGMPPQHHSPVSSVPLPPAWPIQEMETSLPSSAPDASGAHPSVEPGRWVQEPDFWEKETMIAMTGRYPVPRPKTRPLPPPQRFRPVARWKSMLLLGTLVTVTILACVGTIALGKFSIDVFGSQATPTVTRTAQPTVSPTKPPHK